MQSWNQLVNDENIRHLSDNISHISSQLTAHAQAGYAEAVSRVI